MKAPVTIAITPELLNRLDAEARRVNASRSWMVRRLLEAALMSPDYVPCRPAIVERDAVASQAGMAA